MGTPETPPCSSRFALRVRPKGSLWSCPESLPCSRPRGWSRRPASRQHDPIPGWSQPGSRGPAAHRREPAETGVEPFPVRTGGADPGFADRAGCACGQQGSSSCGLAELDKWSLIARPLKICPVGLDG